MLMWSSTLLLLSSTCNLTLTMFFRILQLPSSQTLLTQVYTSFVLPRTLCDINNPSSMDKRQSPTRRTDFLFINVLPLNHKEVRICG